jgi:hypothetical protein
MVLESKIARPLAGSRLVVQSGSKRRKWLWIIITAVVLIVAACIWKTCFDVVVEERIASGEYQAVFLDNGQVYFGSLSEISRDFYSLTDVYYLQTGSASVELGANLALTKLGSEAHGPQDRMEINKTHILFVEDMKEDSKVVQAIQQYKLKQ